MIPKVRSFGYAIARHSLSGSDLWKRDREEHGLRNAGGRAALLHWTRAKTLLAVSRGQGIDVFDEGVEIWLSTNRFIEISCTDVVITARGAEWLETRLKTLDELGQC